MERAQAFAFGLEISLDTASENALGAGTNTDQFIIDLNFLLMAEDKQPWFFTDPQIILDQETKEQFVIIDLKFGVMLTKRFENLKGQRLYIRPSIGIGKNRPSDGSIEIGYKIVGW